MSHLSDAQELLSMGRIDAANVEINASKMLLIDIIKRTDPREKQHREGTR